MKIPNRKLWKLFSLSGRCEICKRFFKTREPHHLRGRTPEITMRINLISLGSSKPLTCSCHFDVHNGKISSQEVLEIVASREHVYVGDITEAMDMLRRLIKPTESELERAIQGLSIDAGVLARRELKEWMAVEERKRKKKVAK